MLARLALLTLLVQAAAPQGSSGTPATVSGRVVDATSGVPIAGAQVSATGTNGKSAGAARETVTDAQGQFTIQDVPAGAVVVQAKSDGYVTSYARTREGAQFTASMIVGAGAHVTGVTIRLPPLGAICGTVIDAKGAPIAKQRVDALTMIANGGLVRFYSSASANTDDAGGYCLDKLYPAHYVVTAVARPDARPPRPALFYPAMTSSALATVIDLRAGARLAGIDLVFPEIALHAVAGHVTKYAPDMFATVSPSDRRVVAPGIESLTAPLQRDGTFRFDAVPSGLFNLEVETFQPSGMRDIEFFGQLPVAVGNADVTDLEVPIANGARVSGSVRFVGATQPAVPAVSVVVASADGETLSHGGAARLGPDGRFVTPQLPPGDYLVMTRPIEGWSPASITWRGADISGAPLHLGSEDIDGVTVTMTDRPPAIDGVVRDEKGAPAIADVLLFPKDPSQWGASSEGATRLVVAPTDVDGAFHLIAMPGDYWIAAVPHDDETDLWDRQTLSRLTVGAQPLHLAIGDSPRVPLHLR